MAVSLPAMMSVGEGDGTAIVCALLFALEDTKTNITIIFATSDGTGNDERYVACIILITPFSFHSNREF